MTGAAALALALQVSIDWAALPSLPYRAPPLVTPQMREFAAREARSCRRHADARAMTVELAVLVDGASQVRTVIPRAIDCATVEQYAAGLVQSFARANLLPRGGASEQWYKTSLTFTWSR